MTPERWTEIKKISTGLGSHGLLVGIIHELIAEVERLQSGLDSAISLHMMDNQTIERLTAELDALRAGLDGLLEKLRDDEAAELRPEPVEGVVRVTGRSEWPGEQNTLKSISAGLAVRALNQALNEGKAIEIPSLGIKVEGKKTLDASGQP